MKRATLALALVLPAGLAWADGAFLNELRDERGRLVAVVPRQSTTIAMRRETVAIVPYLEGAEVLLYVDVRYVFSNPGPAGDLLVGFPEMRARRVQHNCTYECDPDRILARPATIVSFAADAGGRPLAVQALPGSEDYARWFAFTVPFASGDTSLRNRYSAHPGSTTSATNTSHGLEYYAEYILHTGSRWAGAIGTGDILLWRGGRQVLRHFVDLRPTRQDDVHVPLDLTVEPDPGRPLFLWDYGNGRQAESIAPRLETSRVVQQSSSRAGEGLPALGAMALDDDPDSAWVDGGAHGGVGEWLQVPTHRLGRLRGIRVRPGDAAAGVSRIRRLRLTCYDLEGHDPRLTELEALPVELPDQPGEQRVVFPRPVGECDAVRLAIEALHGPDTSHGSLAEVGFIE